VYWIYMAEGSDQRQTVGDINMVMSLKVPQKAG
jgi:hypothetical protein